jgi:hypothetical protein
VQEVRETIKLFQRDRGAIVKAAQKRLEKAKKAQATAQAELSAQRQALDQCMVDQERAREEAGELTVQLQAVKDAIRASEVRTR